MYNPCQFEVVYDPQPRAMLRPVKEQTIDQRRTKFGSKPNHFGLDGLSRNNPPVRPYARNPQHRSILNDNL
jgi:hypothetical protein